MNQESLTYLTATFTTKYKDSWDKNMKEIGIHGGQAFLLNLLWKNDGQSQADLCKALNLSAPTVFNMISRLSENDLIEIRKDAFDARIMRVFLTKKGLRIKDIFLEQWQTFEQKTFEKLSEPERMMFSMLLTKLIN
jgi:MarR family transcriptional regulator, organic hydroperoxide resistance regulator